MSHTENLQWLAESPFAAAVALIERGYVVSSVPFPAGKIDGFGVEPVTFRLGQEQPVERWQYWAHRALMAADAGCPVAVGLDKQGDIHLCFASDDAWQ